MRTNAEEKKRQLLTDVAAGRTALLATARALTPAQQDAVFLGVWCAKDVLAHLAGWDDANREAAAALLAGRLPAFYAYRDADWRSFNARLVAEYRREDFAEMIATVEASLGRLLADLEALPAGEFSKDHGVRFRGYKVTLERLLQADITDVKVHGEQLAAFAAQAAGSA